MKKLFVGLIAAIFSVPVLAAHYKLDTAHSSVTFSIRHLVSKVKGQFRSFDGDFNYDPAKPSSFNLSATIKATSIDTANEKRDTHLRSPDFFDVAKFPTLTYVGKKVTASGKDHYTVDGDLTMHGVTKPVSLNVEFLGQSNDPHDPKIKHGGLSATAKINRKDFGIIWNKVLDQGSTILGDEVEIAIDADAEEAAPAKK